MFMFGIFWFKHPGLYLKKKRYEQIKFAQGGL